MENNCFMSVFLPLAMELPMFLDMILTWSLTHMDLQQHSYQNSVLVIQGRALRALALLYARRLLFWNKILRKLSF